MWTTRATVAAALLVGVAACGGGDNRPDTPAYLPEDVREQQEREAVQFALLQAELPGAVWNISAIESVPVFGDIPPSLTLEPGGVLTGHSGCNEFGGQWTLDRNRIAFGEIFITEMACDAPIMAQEQAILAILNEAILVGIGEEGILFITTLEGQLMTAILVADD